MIKRIFIVLTFFLLTSSTYAADFVTHIDQTYTLTENGASISEAITVTNQTDLTYPTDLSMILYSDQIQSLSVTTSQNQTANFNQTPIAGSTKLNLHFSQPIVGKNQSQTYHLEYISPEIKPDIHAAQYFIPRNQNPNIDTITAVIIPQSICPDPIIFPSSLPLSRQDAFTSVKFNQSDLNQAVTILCHPKRYVNLTFSYQLSNPTMTPVETQITLPPDTAYQRLLFNSITPSPLRLTTDDDGNRIASFHLEPKQTVSISVNASAEITNANTLFQTDRIDTKTLTADQPHWPASNHQIKQLVKQLTTAQDIYQYIVTHAQYNPDQFNNATTRHTGQIILSDTNNLTAEDFTDVFVTLCRAAGIPSRRVISYAPSNNQKLYPQEYPDQSLHIYPEWYDAAHKVWLQVDPFWQTTNPFQNFWPITDQSRITLAIQGIDDSTPYPANTINVTEIPSFTFPSPDITATSQNSLLSKLFPNQTSLMLTNHSLYALYQQPLTIMSDQTPLQSFTLNRLDINDSSIIPLTTNQHQSLTIQTNYGLIPIQPASIAVSPTTAVTAVLVASASLFAVISGRLLVSRRKR